MSRLISKCLEIKCRLDIADFERDFEDLPLSLQEEFKEHSPPCGDGGGLGSWCADCYFCLMFEEYEDSWYDCEKDDNDN